MEEGERESPRARRDSAFKVSVELECAFKVSGSGAGVCSHRTVVKRVYWKRAEISAHTAEGNRARLMLVKCSNHFTMHLTTAKAITEYSQ